MSQAFDPYLRWLGIRDPQRPPNHYRLLGVEVFEADPEVIAGAADRQMAHVRSFQSGQYAEISQKILNELAAARVCLLKADRKIAYDQQLRAAMAPAKAAASPPKVPVRAATAVARPVAVQPARPATESSPFADIVDATAGTSSPRRKLKKKTSLAPLAVVAMLILAVGAFGLFAYTSSQKPQSVAKSPTAKPLEREAKETLPAKTEPRDDQTKQSSGSETSTAEKKEEPPHKPVVEEPESEADVTDSSETNTPPDEREATEPSAGDEEAGEKPSEEGEESPTKQPSDEPAPPQEQADSRLPVPDKESQAAALAIIKDLFKTEYAARKPEDRAAFAKKLLAQAQDSANDATAAYVLYDQAVTLAAAVGDAETALQSTDNLAKLYQVDALATQAEALTALSRTAKLPQASKLLGEKSVALTEEAIAADRYDMAKRFNSLTLAAAKKNKDLSLVNQAQNRSRDIKYLETEYAKIESSLAKLKVMPNDPESNLSVGRYLCFSKGDFESGLRLLMIGGDVVLSQLAKKELNHHDNTDELVSIGDLWWDLSENDRGSAKRQQQAHAVTLYRKSLQSLTGLARTRVEARINDFETQSQPTPSSVTGSMLSQFARELDQEYKLELWPEGEWFNYRGHREKYLRSAGTSIQLYILPDGSIYRFTGKTGTGTPLVGSFVVKLSPSFHQDLSLIYRAAD